jgi:hypothetical protein
MKEDACPIYRGDAAQILATVRHMALNMLRAEKGKTASIRRKQKIAAMNSDYLEHIDRILSDNSLFQIEKWPHL